MTKYRVFSLHWIDVWQDLSRILGNRKNVACQLPDSTIVDIHRCRRWIQESVYRGYVVNVRKGQIDNQNGIVVSLCKPCHTAIPVSRLPN